MANVVVNFNNIKFNSSGGTQSVEIVGAVNEVTLNGVANAPVTLKNIANPSASSDGATKSYVDTAIASQVRPYAAYTSVTGAVAATTANVGRALNPTISSSATALFTVSSTGLVTYTGTTTGVFAVMAAITAINPTNATTFTFFLTKTTPPAAQSFNIVTGQSRMSFTPRSTTPESGTLVSNISLAPNDTLQLSYLTSTNLPANKTYAIDFIAQALFAV